MTFSAGIAPGAAPTVAPSSAPSPAERLVDAARALADQSGSAAFTVAQVAVRAGASLKAFYRCFASKDELLLALFATESRTGAEVLAGMVLERSDDPLHAYIGGIFELATLPGAQGYARVLAQEHRRLSETRADELDAALAPLVNVLTDVVGDRRDARTVLSLVIGGIHDVTLGRAEGTETAEYLWRFCRHGIARPQERSRWP